MAGTLRRLLRLAVLIVTAGQGPALGAKTLELTCSFVRTNMHRPDDWKRPIKLGLDIEKPAVRIQDLQIAQAINVKVTRTTIAFTHGGRFYNYYYNLNRRTNALRMNTMRLFVDYKCTGIRSKDQRTRSVWPAYFTSSPG